MSQTFWEKKKRKKSKKKTKKNKYSAQKSWSYDGYSFSSKGERRCYEYLKLLEKAGEIKFLKTQVHVRMTDAEIIYIPDFLIYDLELHEEVWCEYKGFETDVWKLKRRLWKANYGPGRLRIYKSTRSGEIFLSEEIISDRSNYQPDGRKTP